jgi:hypothetical protein
VKELLNSENKFWVLIVAIVTVIACYPVINSFDRLNDLELIIFASVLGFGVGTIVWLIILSAGATLSSGVFSIFAAWFWYGSYYAISIGGTIGSITGAGCAIFIRISHTKYSLILAKEIVHQYLTLRSMLTH